MLFLMLLQNGILHKSHVLGVKFASIQAKQLAEEKAKEHEEPASKPTTLGPKRRNYVVKDVYTSPSWMMVTL